MSQHGKTSNALVEISPRPRRDIQVLLIICELGEASSKEIMDEIRRRWGDNPDRSKVNKVLRKLSRDKYITLAYIQNKYKYYRITPKGLKLLEYEGYRECVERAQKSWGYLRGSAWMSK